MGRGGPKKYKYTWRDTIPPLAAEAFGDERPDYFFGPVSKIPTDADRVRVVREIEELVTESKKLKAAGKYPRPEVPRSLPPGVGTGGVRH